MSTGLDTTSSVVYELHQVELGTIRIDGEHAEPAWLRAEPITGFVRHPGFDGPAARRTEARLLWSPSHLYLAFLCHTDAIRASDNVRDGEIWTGDAAELFLCPGGADAPYYEINFNPLGAIFDSRILDWRYEQLSQHWQAWAHAFNADIESATRVLRDAEGNVTGWTLEAAIPLADLVDSSAMPAVGTTWLFNVYRAAAEADGSVQFSAWQPTDGDFHRPYTFPRLRFSR